MARRTSQVTAYRPAFFGARTVVLPRPATLTLILVARNVTVWAVASRLRTATVAPPWTGPETSNVARLMVIDGRAAFVHCRADLFVGVGGREGSGGMAEETEGETLGAGVRWAAVCEVWPQAASPTTSEPAEAINSERDMSGTLRRAG
jgi:hypothetical protein